MAAYGALVSLMHIIDRIEKHPSPPISIHKEQVQSLTENVTLLQEFLDGYISPVVDSHEADPLECRIADAVYAAADVIESQIVDQIDRQSTIVGKMITFINLFRGLCKCATIEEDFYHNLQQVIEEMNLIKKDAMETAMQAQLHQRISSTQSGSLKSSSTVKDNMMVGFDQVFDEVVDKLNGGQLKRQIIPITGMGGIGKTTLARNLFRSACVREHFHICAWTTISQTYSVRETLREVYDQASEDDKKEDGKKEDGKKDLSENDLGDKLYKYLSGRRYLIIMDDMWSIEVWDKMRFFFPDYNNGSRIIVTTRLLNLSSQLNKSYGVGMKFLDEASSWGLFCKIVFGKESCPLELESIGKNIVASCKGLPLSIATIGGLLAKSGYKIEYWERIEQNLNSTVINNNDEYCLKILRMSYIYLPNYLKPCFLYMGVFEEDRSIRVSMLEKLWVSEGFLKPRSGKCLETVAQDYFRELVDRNLVLVDKLGSLGNVKYCQIHDLLRDLCLKEFKKERFYHVIRVDPEAMIRNPHRLLRTLRAYYRDVEKYYNDYFLDKVFQLVNSRCLVVRFDHSSIFPSSIDLLWNLHTLIMDCPYNLVAPIEIWKLHQLQHLEVSSCRFNLPDPPSGDNDIVIMENLQTLKGVWDLIWNEEVVKRIPNVKKLNIIYSWRTWGVNCLSYLQCLSKLENLCCSIKYGSDECFQWIRFPHSLKKLSVIASNSIASGDHALELEDIMPKISSLPLLEKFVLRYGCFKTGKWETIEGQFPSLKFLDLDLCRGLEEWIVSDNSHFPHLQKLYICGLGRLKEIPSEVGEIATLKSIVVDHCSESAVVSAKKIVEDQEDSYGDQLDLHVRAIVGWNQEALKSLASANFEVQVS